MLQKDVKTLSVRTQQPSQSADRSVMLFEMAIYGHHAAYIRHLVRYWCQQGLAGHFYLVVTAQFIAECADIVAIEQEYPQSKVTFLVITPAEEASLTQHLSSFIQRKARAWQEWNLLCSYARQLQVTHCLLASFDFFQWPFLLAQKPPCPISSIYFKPTFHYASFSGYEPTLKSRLQHRLEKMMLSAIFRQPHLHRLFCLDPFAVEALNKGNRQHKVVALADPVEMNTPQVYSSKLRSQLEIDPQRTVFLLFGNLTERKGVEQMLEAIAQLSTGHCQQLCFLLVGRCDPATQQQFQTKILQTCSNRPAQIITRYGFISQQAVAEYFQLADVVLAPYQKHIGMSGILLQAAAAQKPVLSSDYGLMGEIVRAYQLGLAVDSTQPSELKAALIRFLESSPNSFFNREKIKQFVEQNTVEKFASTILNIFEPQS